MVKCCFVQALFLWGLCLSSAAQMDVLRGGLQVENLSPPFSPVYSHGAAELRYRLTNLSSNDLRRVTLSYPPGRNSGELIRASRTIELIPPNESRVVTLAIPPLPFYASNQIRVDYGGRSEIAQAPSRSFARFHHTKGSHPSVLVGYSLNHRDLQSALASLSADEGVVKHEVGMSEWSPNWISYAQFDTVMLARADYDNLGAAAREGLHHYVEAGGSLTLLGALPQLPAHWKKPSQQGGIARSKVGFGSLIHVPKATTIKAVPTRLWTSLNRQWNQLRGAKANLSEGQLSGIAKVVGDLNLPVLPLFLLMLAFAIVIGPVNLFLLDRRKKRIWMLWTVPLISALTCGLVFLFSILSEGITPNRAYTSYTLLDQASGHAVTVGAVGVYAPLAPSKGFRFEHDTQVLPVTSSNMSGELVHGKDQHFARGWALARVPIYFDLRRAHRSKLRLEVAKVEAGGIEVLNGFGSKIDQLWVTNASGEMFEVGDIGAGAKATARPSGRIVPNRGIGFLGTVQPHELAKLESASSHDTRLGANSYIALLKEAHPMLPDVLPGRTKTQRTYIHGLYEPPKGGRP